MYVPEFSCFPLCFFGSDTKERLLELALWLLELFGKFYERRIFLFSEFWSFGSMLALCVAVYRFFFFIV